MKPRARSLRRRLHGILFRLPTMITCQEFEGFILAYLEDELSAKQKRIFEMHLRLCNECRVYLSAYRHVLDATKSLAVDHHEQLEDVPADLVAAILDARR